MVETTEILPRSTTDIVSTKDIARRFSTILESKNSGF